MRHPNVPPFSQWICPETKKPYRVAWSVLTPYDSCEQCRPGEIANLVRELANPPHVATRPPDPRPRFR